MNSNSTRLLKYVLASLNSKLGNFELRQICSNLGEKGLELRKIFMENFPIPKISESQQKPFELLVDEILTKKSKDEDTQNLENQIDSLVYALYQLTDQEIELIKKN